MKKIYALMAIIAILVASNCSRIPENNDPVIGIWFKVETIENAGSNETQRQEWIFNDVYLGRYQRYSGNELVFKTDFNWKIENETYTVNYPGTEMPQVKVTRKASPEGESLEDMEGNIVAIRE